MHNGHHCLYGELTSTNPELASVSLRMNSPVRAPCVRYRISIFKKDDTLARVYLHSVPVYSVQCTSASVQLPTYCHALLKVAQFVQSCRFLPVDGTVTTKLAS